MSMLDALGGGARKATVLTALVSTLQDRGGLPALVKMFDQAGLSEILQSWLSGGENRSISPSQVLQALGPSGGGILGAVARSAGLGEEDTASELSQVLPKAIDLLSPDGAVPEGPLGDIATKAFGKLFG